MILVPTMDAIDLWAEGERGARRTREAGHRDGGGVPRLQRLLTGLDDALAELEKATVDL